MPRSGRTNSRRSKNNDRHIAKIAKKVLYKSSETKVKMNHINETSFSTTAYGYFYDPMRIPVGSAIDQRVGNNITLSGIQLKGVFSSLASLTDQYVRMAIFYTTDRTDVGPSSEVFVNSNHATLTSATIGGLDKMYHPFNKSYVKVLHDKVYKLAGTDSGTGKRTRLFNTFVKLRNRKITYESGGDGGGLNVSPRLHVGIWTADSKDDNASAIVEMSSMMRLWYKDL